MTVRTLIVDDEPHARARIRRLLTPEPRVQVVGECESGVDAAHAIRTLRPDLLFLDVQIRGATAFEIIEEIGPEQMPVTIFVTAHAEHALQAFDLEAADYLLKPFDQSRFRRALARGIARLEAEPEPTAAAAVVEWFMLRSSGRELRVLRAAEVEWIEACGNYVYLHTAGARHLYRQTMTTLEARLNPRRFARIHRSTIINVHALASLEPIYAGDYEVKLKSGTVVRMSRNYRGALERLTGRAG